MGAPDPGQVLAGHSRRWALNPIVVKELRSRMRGGRAFAILTGMLILLGGVSYALYRIVSVTATYAQTPLSPLIGQTVFIGLSSLEMVVLCILTPAITAGAISSEWEKATYGMLLATPLRPGSILRGKLVSGLSYILLLVFAAVPLFSLVFIFGGVALLQMLKALLVLLVVAVTLGMVGIFMSAWLKRTARATVLSYLLVLVLLLGPAVAYILSAVLRQAEPPRWLLVPNPLSALFSALAPTMPSSGPASILSSLSMALSGDLAMMGRPGLLGGARRPLYHYTLALYSMLTVMLYLLSIRLIQPVRRWRFGWKEILAALILVLACAGIVAMGFTLTAHRYEGAGSWVTPTPWVAQPVIVKEVMVERAIGLPRPIPTAAPKPTEVPQLADEDQATIYAIALRDLLDTARAFEVLPEALIVYIQTETLDGTVDPSAPRARSRLLPEGVQQAVLAGLTDLPDQFVWGQPLEGETGAILSLGNIHLHREGDGTQRASVSVSLYLGKPGSIGQAYVLEQVGGKWQVIEDARNSDP